MSISPPRCLFPPIKQCQRFEPILNTSRQTQSRLLRCFLRHLQRDVPIKLLQQNGFWHLMIWGVTQPSPCLGVSSLLLLQSEFLSSMLCSLSPSVESLCFKRVPCLLQLNPCVLNVSPVSFSWFLCLLNMFPVSFSWFLVLNAFPISFSWFLVFLSVSCPLQLIPCVLTCVLSPPGTCLRSRWSRTCPLAVWRATTAAQLSWSPTLSNVSAANLSYIRYNILILLPVFCLFIKTCVCESGGSHDLMFEEPSPKGLACSSSNGL